MFPSLGFQVLVPTDRLEEALRIVEDAVGVTTAPAMPAWRCAQCGESIDGGLDACWSCGTSRDGDPAEPIERVSLPPAHEEHPRLPVFRTFWSALRLIAAHPTIFLATTPVLLWEGMRAVLAIPPSSPPEAVTWHWLAAELPPALLFEPVAAGLAIAYADQASRGRASWRSSADHVARKLPRLLALAALLAVASFSLVAASWLLSVVPYPVVVGPLVVALLYLGVRLMLVQVSIVVDDVDVRSAFERSWALTRGQWWRLFALVVSIGVTVPPGSWFPPSIYLVVQALLAPISSVVLLLAYRELAASRSLGRSVDASLRPLGVLPA